MKKQLLILIFLANLLAIMALWWHGSSILLTAGTQAGLLIALGRLAGLLGEFFILNQLVLIGRVVWVEQLFGHDRLNQVHRWVGYGILIFFLSHPLLLTMGYAQLSETTLGAQFINFLQNWEDVFKALIGLILFFVLTGVSIAIVKKRLRYETWYFSHLAMYAAIGLAFGHQTNSGDMSSGGALYYWLALNFIVFGLLLAFRWLRPFYLFYRHRFYVEKIVAEKSGVHSVYIGGRNLPGFRFRAGQFANLTFLQKGMWFTHPFSFSMAPNGKFLRFSVKASGDFTNKIHKILPGTKLIIDGPLGLFTADQSGRDKFLLIAGGIGITPIRALAESLQQNSKDSVLLYGCKNPDDVVFGDELQTMAPKHHYIFSQNGIADDPLSSGRIEKNKIINLVPDFKEREIYMCGPIPMMKQLVLEFKALGLPKKQIHFEKFNY